MIALDTNVLLRLILHDDEPQARVAERLLVRARREQEPIWISDIVLCELVWVLRRRAELSRADIAATLETLLHTESIVTSDARTVELALEAYRAGKGDFADYLVCEQAAAAGAAAVLTLDRVLKGEAGFRLIA